jgi:UDP-glucose 4-epimerase
MNIQINRKYVLITGGLGYIGSHAAVQILDKMYNVIILDNLSNSKLSTLTKIEKLSNVNDTRLIFIRGDICDIVVLDMIFTTYKINLVMHFAALKSVSESQLYPDLYQNINVYGTQTLLNIMNKYGCINFIYSSSATVYGSPVLSCNSEVTITEKTQTGVNILCNYGKNKYDIEQYLINNNRIGGIFQNWKIVILRYFNPIGSHPSGLLGEDPSDTPNNIFPYMLRVAKWTNNIESEYKKSNYEFLNVFGNDYNTPDGTCIRDFIHVNDLARAHLIVYEKIIQISECKSNTYIYNIGTGKGVSVLELVTIFNDILIKKEKKPINYKIGPRRDGDIVVSYANVDKIYNDIGFSTQYDVYQMCADGLKFIGL